MKNIQSKFVLAVAFLICSPAFAQLEKVNKTMSNVQGILAGVAVTICTLAIMFTGFKMMFQHAKWAEVSNIVIGAMFVGGATGIAAWLVG
jgi:type IV secretion system protein VirB2